MRAKTEKKAIAGRLFEIICDTGGTITGFRKKAKARGYSEVYNNSRFWLPPAHKWAWDPLATEWKAKTRQGERGSAGDWDEVRLPNGECLLQFCEFTYASADYILFGWGSPYRGQSRTTAELSSDVAAAVWNSLRQQELDVFVKYSLGSHSEVPPQLRKDRLIPLLVDAVRNELVAWLEYNSRLDAALEAALTALTIWQRGEILRMTGEKPTKEAVETGKEVLMAAFEGVINSAVPAEPDTQLIDSFRAIRLTRPDGSTAVQFGTKNVVALMPGETRPIAGVVNYR